ncbi:hypothetical protein FBQ97_03435 [Acidobacteria bacterium ACD]|nr:hypothetical protein [Acidobacteria bacterium ACD]
MRKHWAWIYIGAGWIGVPCTVAAALLTGSLKLEQDSFRLLAGVIEWFQKRAAVYAFGAVVIAATMNMVRRYLGRPWVWTAIHSELDLVRDLVFSAKRSESEHHHRVTLYKFSYLPTNRLKLFRVGRWLVPVERSGIHTRKDVAQFKVPDEADRAEGVAGQAWARPEGEILMTDALPDMNGNSSDAEVENYAKATFVSAAWVRKKIADGSKLPRRLCGMRVECNGKAWGVIVVDSRSSDSLSVEMAFQLSANHLGALLQGARE